MEHIGSRIRVFREEMGLTQIDLFRSTGIKQTTLSSIESGTEPKAGIVGAMLAAYPTLSPDWLLTGNGPMLRDERVETPLELPAGQPARQIQMPVAVQAPIERPAVAGSQIDFVGKLVSTLEKQADDKDRVIERQNEQLDKKDRLIEALRHIIEDRLGIDNFSTEDFDQDQEQEQQPEPRKKAEGNWSPAAANAAQFRVKLEATRKPLRLIDRPMYRRPGFRQETKVINFHTYLLPSVPVTHQEKKTA